MKKISTLLIILAAIGLCFSYTYHDSIDDFTSLSAVGMSYRDYIMFIFFNSLTMILLTPFILRLKKNNNSSLRNRLILIGVLFHAALTYSSLTLHNELVCQWTTCDSGFLFTFSLQFFSKWFSIVCTGIFIRVVYFFAHTQKSNIPSETNT